MDGQAATGKPARTEAPGVPAGECRTLDDIRREIDRVDRLLVRLMAERLTYIERAGVIKRSKETVRDEARIEDVVAKVLVAATREGVPPEIAEPIWRQLIELSIAHEHVVFDAAHADET